MRRGFVSLLFILLAGCATITKGITQSIYSYARRTAQCTLASSAIGNKTVYTPATLTVDKGVGKASSSAARKSAFRTEPGHRLQHRDDDAGNGLGSMRQPAP